MTDPRLSASAGDDVGAGGRDAVDDLRDAQERWRLILRTAHDAFVSIDERGVIIEWNRRAEEVFGWLRDDVIGRELVDTIVPPEMRDAHLAGLERFLETGEGPVLFQTIELPALHRTRGRFDAEVTIWPHRLGDRWTFHAFIRDVTQDKRIRAHVALLQRVTSVANEASDIEVTTETALEEVCELTGWPLGHAYLVDPDASDRLEPTPWWWGDGFDEFVERTERTAFPRGEGLPGRVLESGAPAWISDLSADPNFPRAETALDCGLRSAFGFPVRAGDEVVAVLEFYSTEMAEPDEALLELMADVGVQLGRVFERVRATEQLRAADRMKARLIQTVSHEMRTPLAVMTGFSELLAEDWDVLPEEEKRTYVDSIHRQAERLTRLAEGLLTTSRIEAGVLTPRPEEVALLDFVHDVLVDVEPGDVEVEVDPDVVVRVDRDHLAQIVTNLLSNAVQHGQPPVRVGSGHDDGAVRLRVTDAGSGVPPEARETLFDRFVTSSDTSDGTGLGLSISRDLARLNGGDLWYESRDGAGATFIVRLPSG